MKRLAIGSLALLFLLGATGCRSMTGKTVGQNVDDATIQAEVKAKLAAQRLSTLTRVNVDTVKGVVYLNGVVPTTHDKAEAERIASAVHGVRGVVDNLVTQDARTTATVGSAPTTPAATASTVSASAATTDGLGRRSVTGDVTSVDHATGRLTVRTDEGTVDLNFPPASVRNVKNGDRVRLDVGFEPVTR